MGGATVSDEQVLGVDAGAPHRIYVAQFAMAPGAMKPASGIAAGTADIVEARPHLLGGGILGRRLTADTPSADTVLATLATSITNALNAQQLGVPAEQLRPGAALPASGWIVNGQLLSVDPGNRAQRAVIGFGAGEATTEVAVEVSRLGPGTATPILRFGTQADSGKMPGAVVTMNPYVAAAKFVLGKNATTHDVQAMGEEIAKQIADYARSRGVTQD